MLVIVALMLAVYCMGLCVCDTLTGKPQKTVKAAMRFSAFFDSVLIILSFAGVTVIYDTGIYWIASQIVLCPLLIVCAAIELYQRKIKGHILILAFIFLMVAVLLDIAGVGRSIYSYGTCTKRHGYGADRLRLLQLSQDRQTGISRRVHAPVQLGGRYRGFSQSKMNPVQTLQAV